MTAIEAVTSYLPEQRVSVEDVAGRLGLTSMQTRLFRRFLGLAEMPGQVVIAPAGQPCTGVWWEVAGGPPAWSAQVAGRVLLADYDPLLGHLCMATIEVPGGRR